MMPLVYIILVNYRGYNDTVECIQSLENIDYENYRIIVVDNASGDHSFERLKEEFPKHIVLEAADNLGFSGGNNIGIQYALENNAAYVLLLNNDTTVEPNFLSNMVAMFEKDKDTSADADAEIGIVGGKILLFGNGNIISHAGGYIDLFKFNTVHCGVNAHRDDEAFNSEKEVGFISGCMMLIKKELFKKIGLLSEEYFMYYEDTDFCLSAMNNGYRLMYCPEAEIYHKVSMSSGGEDSPFFLKWNTRNRLIFMNKYRQESSKPRFALSLLYVYATRILRMFIYSMKGNREKANAIRLGLIEGRKKIKSDRKS